MFRNKRSMSEQTCSRPIHETCWRQEQQQPSSRNADAIQASYLESVPRLREDVEEAQAEVSHAQEQEQMKQIEVTELQRQRNELRQQLHEAEEAHRAVSIADLCM